SFSMTPGNQHFIVDIKVKVQRRDARTKKVVDDFRSQEFRFNHDLTLIRPGMSWQQQKALAHQVASMNSEEALHAWFANESALLRTDFASDLKQVNEGLKLFFGDQAN
ncbi:MAG TPA: hypothetical protein VFL15_06670, partial [Gammaproteobacteria bacterium]|nr:hypothetical protein [Gammaproteobacteria bacterium]